jgi:diguanylate cyclase (GGDEF)-like protein/PAS domain S-box-containing protein
MIPEMGSDDDAADDYGLAAALKAHPDALITGITEDGQFCPLPEALGATQAILGGTSVFELVPQHEWASIGAGWLRVLQHGNHVGTVVTNEGERVSLLTYDAREHYGMVVMLMVPNATLGEASTDDQRPVVARFGIYHRDALATIVGMDEGAEGLLGWSVDDLVGVAANDLIHPDDQANGLENWLATLAAPGQARRWRGRHRHKDGTYRWIEFTNTNRMETAGHVVSEMMDVSEEMATAEALREQRELLARLNEALPLGVCQIDRDWNVVYANNQLYDLVGRDPGEDLATALADVAGDDLPKLTAAVESVLGAGPDHNFELRLHLESGTERVCLVNLRALRDADDAITGAVVCVSDITEATVLRRELEIQATVDPLTGCQNRAATMTALRRAMHAGPGTGPGPGTAAVFIDLDRFKPVNDELGHAAGDELLVTVARRLHALVRDGDTVGRVGGDEFLVVCPKTAGAATAMRIGERIAAELAQPFKLIGSTVTIGASVGVAWTDSPDATADSLVATADAAMYRSKRAGRSQAVLA